MLPFIEQSALWDAIREAYRTNRSFGRVPPHSHRATIVSTFICPADNRAAGIGTDESGDAVAFTTYLGVTGVDHSECNGVLFLESRVNFGQVTDGLSATLMVGERPPSPDDRFAWWYAGMGQEGEGNADSSLGVHELRTSTHPNDKVCFVGPYRFGPGRVDNQCDAFHYWSHHPGGAQFAFCDGSVRFLAYSADPIMPALATRAGGEAVAVPD